MFIVKKSRTPDLILFSNIILYAKVSVMAGKDISIRPSIRNKHNMIDLGWSEIIGGKQVIDRIDRILLIIFFPSNSFF